MPRRIHVVGTAARSGTTLMMQLMTSCFEIDRFCGHERRIFKSIPRGCSIYCSKHPLDILGAPILLAMDPHLFMICLVRDPRDTVVSKHQRFPDRYWGASLDKWKRRYGIAKRLASHPRFVIVTYESLVDDPDRIQNALMNRMPFLRRRANFSQYHKVAKPSNRAERALGGVRPITAGSIGAWRSHKPRLAAQLALHGNIADELIALGLERDQLWLRELTGVNADNGLTYRPDRGYLTAALYDRLTAAGNISLYALTMLRQHLTGSRRS